MKKKAGWSTYSKPFAPSPPRKPEEFYENTSRAPFFTANAYEIKLSDIPLPEGVALHEIKMHANADYSGDVEVEFFIEKTVTIRDPNFPKMMKDYEKRLEEYKVEKEKHAQEVKDWEVWKKEEETKQLERQLKHATNLLKKHGRLK